ncbi:hypothetical protein N7G274_004883 [Stereocaulon virgatum]|uniref:CBF1-interacting co-repressor CIR N-terminal domain-containing protein n=1 Tax=Stereocaulon virgatum TaxID=373712 RepID=A0ABR4ABF4_9LECA
MPLHLLGKKSWNVYNADNIAKVKQDEADVAAREEAEEQRMQEVDAERRIQILRGLQVEAPPAAVQESEGNRRGNRDVSDRKRKRRRIVGEDDTDRDIRFAQENSALVLAKAEMQMKSKKSSDAPITDTKGHINLFPVDSSRQNVRKNAEVEAEKAKKQKGYEDQYTMRFSNAAGFKQAVGQEPWYHSNGASGDKDGGVGTPSKDVWGNEDPRRKERGKMRMAADDPLAAIQQGVACIRQVEKERKKWKEEKNREIREIEEAERRRERKRRRRREEKDLHGFSLDGCTRDEEKGLHRTMDDNGSSRHRHRHRSRSRDRGPHRSHSHRHRSTKAKDRPGWEVGPGGRYSSQFAQA